MPLDSPLPPPLPRFDAGCLHTLAYGALTERDVSELHALKRQIQDSIGFQCDGYKEKCLRRRIAVRMRARGVHSYARYAELLGDDAEEHRRLAEAMTINVSKFFRNREVWEVVRATVLPALLERGFREIRIWSAGCAAGEEAYSIAMLVLELASERGIDPRRFKITGTDIDRTTLDLARQGEYPEYAFGEIDPTMRERWFEGADLRRVRPDLRRIVRFEPLDLIADAFAGGQHLIFCRNVIIYFERRIQEDLFGRFRAALTPGGFMVLGKVETLFGAHGRTFHPIAARERVFQKP